MRKIIVAVLVSGLLTIMGCGHQSNNGSGTSQSSIAGGRIKYSPAKKLVKPILLAEIPEVGNVFSVDGDNAYTAKITIDSSGKRFTVIEILDIKYGKPVVRTRSKTYEGDIYFGKDKGYVFGIGESSILILDAVTLQEINCIKFRSGRYWTIASDDEGNCCLYQLYGNSFYFVAEEDLVSFSVEEEPLRAGFRDRPLETTFVVVYSGKAYFFMWTEICQEYRDSEGYWHSSCYYSDVIMVYDAESGAYVSAMDSKDSAYGYVNTGWPIGVFGGRIYFVEDYEANWGSSIKSYDTETGQIATAVDLKEHFYSRNPSSKKGLMVETGQSKIVNGYLLANYQMMDVMDSSPGAKGFVAVSLMDNPKNIVDLDELIGRFIINNDKFHLKKGDNLQVYRIFQ